MPRFLDFSCFGLVPASLAVVLTLGLSAGLDAKNVNIRDFGATADGGGNDRAAIQRAIDDVAAAGGGRVTVPAGRFDAQMIRMKSNVELHLAGGAVLKGSPRGSDYSQPWQYNNAMVLGFDLNNVKVTGPGKIDGSDSESPDGEGGERGAHGILLHRCDNVTIDGPRIERAGNYSMYLNGSTNIRVQNVRTYRGWDGVHVRRARGAVFRNLDIIDARDDGVAGNFNDDFEFYDIYMRGDESKGGTNGFRFGCNGCKSRRVTIRDRRGSAVWLFSPSDHGIPSGRKLESHNWDMADWRLHNVDRFLYYNSDDKWADALPNGTLRFDRIRGTGMKHASVIVNSRFGNSTMELIATNVQCRYTGVANTFDWSPYAFFARDIKQLHLYRCEFDFTGNETRQAVKVVNVNTAVADGVRAKGTGADHLIDVRDAVHACSGPSNHWRFEGNGNDSIGPFDLSMRNNANVRHGNRMEGDFAMQGGASAHGITSHPAAGNAFGRCTVGFWIRPKNVNNTQVVYDEGGKSNGLAVRIRDGKIEAIARQNGKQTFCSRGGLRAWQWNHVVVAFVNDYMRVHVNGGRPFSQANGATWGVGGHEASIAIGNRVGDTAFDSPDGGFDGWIDGVRRYPNLFIDPAGVDAWLGPADGSRVSIQTWNAGRVLDCSGGGTANGTKVQAWDAYRGNGGQMWNLQRRSDNDYYLRASHAGNKRLNVSGGGTANGTALQIWDTGARESRWRFIDYGDHWGLVPSHAVGRMLDVEGAGGTRGRPARIWANAINHPNQKWRVVVPDYR